MEPVEAAKVEKVAEPVEAAKPAKTAETAAAKCKTAGEPVEGRLVS